MENRKDPTKQHYSTKQNYMSVSIKDIDTKTRTVTGLYNAYNYLDSGGDVLVDGCAALSIKNHGPMSGEFTPKIKHALFHDLTRLPGRIAVLEEREVELSGIGKVKGIYFETVMLNTSEGSDTLTNYLGGVYDNHSIGYRTMNGTYIDRESKEWDKVVGMLINPQAAEAKDDIYLVKEIKMYEGSTVSFGMNDLTPFLGMAKSDALLQSKTLREAVAMKIQEKISLFTNILKHGTQTDDTMRMIEAHELQLKQMVHDLNAMPPEADIEQMLRDKKQAQQQHEAAYKPGDFKLA